MPNWLRQNWFKLIMVILIGLITVALLKIAIRTPSENNISEKNPSNQEVQINIATSTRFYVSANIANIRECASINCKIVAQYPQNAWWDFPASLNYKTLNDLPEWVRVEWSIESTSEKGDGYINKILLSDTQTAKNIFSPPTNPNKTEIQNNTQLNSTVEDSIALTSLKIQCGQLGIAYEKEQQAISTKTGQMFILSSDYGYSPSIKSCYYSGGFAITTPGLGLISYYVKDLITSDVLINVTIPSSDTEETRKQKINDFVYREALLLGK